MTINIILPFKPYPQGKTRLANNGMPSEKIVSLQKQLLQKNIQLISKSIPSSIIYILTTDFSLAKNYMISSPTQTLISSDLYPNETLGKQLEAFLQNKQWDYAIILVSDLANLLPTTLKGVYSLLSIYDGIVVPTADEGTGIIGMRQKIFSHLDYFGKKSAQRFISEWENKNFLVAEFNQSPTLFDIDDLSDLSFARKKGYL
jgi:2-phospho-L-lactate guanylyltransferase (CobY/MobA/RfbA family)